MSEKNMDAFSQERGETEALKEKVAGLLRDIEGFKSSLETNVQQLRAGRDQEIAELRAEYDRCLDRGDGDDADRCLDKIREARQKLESIARNVLNSDSDISALSERTETLRQESIELRTRTDEICEAAKKLNGEAAVVLAMISESASYKLVKIGTLIGESKKIAQKILDE